MRLTRKPPRVHQCISDPNGRTRKREHIRSLYQHCFYKTSGPINFRICAAEAGTRRTV